MLTTTVFPGRYVQGYDALQALGEEVERFSSKALFLADPFVIDSIRPSFEDALGEHLDYRVERFEGECSDEEIERISQVVRDGRYGVVVGLGGGKTLDTAKAVAHHTDCPCGHRPYDRLVCCRHQRPVGHLHIRGRLRPLPVPSAQS